MRLSGTHCCLFLIKSLRCKTSLRPHVQVLVTTSRDPSSSLTAFAKEIALLLPGAKTQNRGATILSQLVDSCRSSSVTDIVILHEHRCGACLVSALCLPCVCLAPALFFFAVRRQPCAYLAAPASRVLTLRRQPCACLEAPSLRPCVPTVHTPVLARCCSCTAEVAVLVTAPQHVCSAYSIQQAAQASPPGVKALWQAATAAAI